MATLIDIIEPAELTGYARESMNALEEKKGSLATWLPNRMVDDVLVRFVADGAGLVEEARFRAFGAATESGKAPDSKRVTLDLPALGQSIGLDEYSRLRLRKSGEERLKREIVSRTDAAVAAVSDAIERMRGIVLLTGKATIDQPNYKSEDDFGRSAEMAPTAAQLWTNTGARKVLDDLRTWHEKYVEVNGEEPGTLLVSTRVLGLIASANEFRTSLADGSTRPASIQQINDLLASYGLPMLTKYDRRTKSGSVLGNEHLLFLPAPAAFDAPEDTQLGATFWGLSESATKPGWEIPEEDQPGIVAAAFEGEKPGEATEVIADAIGLPVLANPNLAMACKVA